MASAVHPAYKISRSAQDPYETDDHSYDSRRLSGPQEDPHKIRAAIFYSISSPQKGLQGIDLGNLIIKQVSQAIISEFPHIDQLSSLSPIPGFREYLLNEISSIIQGKAKKCETFFTNEEQRLMEEHIFNKQPPKDPISFWQEISKLIRTNSWVEDENLINLFKNPLMRKGAYYLYAEKRRGYVVNPVANFHLRNGAVIWRLNWMADCSVKGLSASCGLMVNYRYYLDTLAENSINYVENKQVAADKQFLELLKPYNLGSKL